ncbi:associated with zinc fingers domain-containing protein [Phthorimaea operculella]|nr:associated with zinc fingers domain-containing protein [Phthorimaea operculella]
MAAETANALLTELLRVLGENEDIRSRLTKASPLFGKLLSSDPATAPAVPNSESADDSSASPSANSAPLTHDESPLSPDPPSPADENGLNSDVEDMDVAATSSESEVDPEMVAEGFTPVTKKRKKRTLKSPLPDQSAKAARVGGADSSRRKPAAPPAPKAASAKERTPPPIILPDNAKWSSLSSQMTLKSRPRLRATQSKDGIRIQVPTSTAHRQLTKLMDFLQFPYHTYALEEEKLHRVVIRGIPKELSEQEVHDDLVSQGIAVTNVHRIKSHKNKRIFDMVHVTLERSEAGKAIYGVKTVCNLSGIRLEAPRKTGIPGQCHNCQVYGHSSRTCHAIPRCVKCADNHSTAQCTRPKKTDPPAADSSTPALPPVCVLCGETGHPANYRGCPRAPKANPKVLARLLAKAAQANKSAGAQKQPSDTADNCNFPPPRPAWGPKTGPTPPAPLPPKPLAPPKTAPAKKAPPPPSPPRPTPPPKANAQGDLADALSVVSSFTSLFDVEEIIAYSEEIKANAGNAAALMQVAVRYSGLVLAFKNFKPQ